MMLLRRWKVLILTSLGVAVTLVIVLLAGGWFVSESIRADVLECQKRDPQPDLEVVEIEQGQITLRVTPLANDEGDWNSDGIYGLESLVGYDQVGAIINISDQQVVRDLVRLTGTTGVGDLVRLDHFAFPGDPETAFGLRFEHVQYSSQLSDRSGWFPAWFVDGPSDRWVILLHGRRVSPREALRMLPIMAELGLPSLSITYRNDFWAPKSEDCFYRYGQTEWRDLEGAVSYAMEHGADNVVLVGYSYGGAIVTNFLYQSSLAGEVRGVILDAPMLDLNAIIQSAAGERNIPGPFLTSAKIIARYRFDLQWGQLNYLDRTEELAVPILLFHGDADDEVPVETSDKLYELRPDIVTYVRVKGAGHARSWNADRETYEAAVRDFLRTVTQ